MNAPDLTGWTPHHGGGVPEALDGDDEVMVLLRGKPETGPRESGPALVHNLEWNHAFGEMVMPLDPMLVLTHGILQPAGDVIGWRNAQDLGHRREYPHVRADLGR